jgi:proteic killer suppression protein
MHRCWFFVISAASMVVGKIEGFRTRRGAGKMELDECQIAFYISADNHREAMIESFKHKGLRQLFEDDNARGVNAEHLRKIRQILGVLHAAETIEALRLPTLGLHPLKGDLKGWWAVTVRANWRVIFRFENGKASDVDLVDYH